VYAAIAERALPVGLSGIVLAAAVAAMMSTASGALIACATVCRADVTPLVLRMFGRKEAAIGEGNPEHDVRENRIFVIVLGIVATVIAMVLSDVVAALTVAYDILVGGLLVSILGGLVWKRANGAGAISSMVVGTVVTLGSMAVYAALAGDLLSGVFANEPVYWGLLSSLLVYVVVSLTTRPTASDVVTTWNERLAGRVEVTRPASIVTPDGRSA
jgi:SSS family solute:Na+ symporter